MPKKKKYCKYGYNPDGSCKKKPRVHRKRYYEPRWHHGINKINLQNYYVKITGLPIDTYDWGALDRSLTYSEAKRQIAQETGATKKKSLSITKRELQEYDEQQLWSRHEDRTDRAKMIDENIDAKVIFEKDDPNTEKWLKKPNQYDVEGIDDKR